VLFATLAQLPARDSAAARRLWTAAFDAEALLQDDSAIALLARARAVDPEFFPAQFEYYRLLWSDGGEFTPLDRAAAVPDPRGGRVTQCLALVLPAQLHIRAASPPASLPEVARLIRMEPADSTGCAATYLSPLIAFGERRITDQTIRLARRAAAMAPDITENWIRLATILWEGPHHDMTQAEAVLQAGVRHATHPLQRASLYATLIQLRLVLNDSLGAGRLTAALLPALARDGRPALRLISSGLSRSWLEHNLYAVGVYDAAGDWRGRWAILRNLGKGYVDHGDFARAIPVLDSAVWLADSVRSPWRLLVGRMLRGRAEAKLGRTREAERDLRAALLAGVRAPDVYYIAESWHNLAHMYEGEGRWAEAAAAADHFVALTRPMRYEPLRMMSLHDAGMIRWEAGWHAAAAADFAEMVRVVDDQQIPANSYWAGEYFERAGSLRRALAYYQASAAAGGGEVSRPLAGLVRVYEALGQDDSAARAAALHDSLMLNWTPLERPLVPRLLARQGHGPEAAALDRKWAVRQLGSGNVQGAAIATLELVDLLLATGHADSAAVESLRAESLATSLHLTNELISAETLRGRALFALGDHEGALGALHAAAALAAARPTADGVLTTQLALGDALAAASRPQEALAAYGRAARTVERVTIGLRGDIDRAGYRERHLRPFDGALRVLLGATTPPRSARDAAVLWSQRRKATALALATTDAARPPAPLDRAALQRRLGSREALVDYVVTDSLVAAIVLTDRGAAVMRLPVTRDSLSVLVERLRHPLVTTFAGQLDLSRAPYDLALAHALYAALVGPLEPALAGRDRWFIIPDGPLYALSFEALVTSAPPPGPPDYSAASYLLDRVQVSYLPTAQFLSPPGDRGGTLAGTRVLAVAGSAPGSAQEVAAIRGAFSAARVRVLSLDTATETAVRAAAGSYAIIHLATHAEVDNTDPLASNLRLAPDGANDGYLHENEIAGTRWRARLVVLSACETIGGRLYEGEGLMGLARAFLAGGARAVVATQWPIGAASADLMDAFYQRLAAGSPPDVALHDAQTALRRSPATSHPFYWATFVLVEGR